MYHALVCVLHPFVRAYRWLFPYRAFVVLVGDRTMRATGALEAMVISVRHGVQVSFKDHDDDFVGTVITFYGPEMAPVRAARREMLTWRHR